eukprot:5723482-Amphidinium_carterae.1
MVRLSGMDALAKSAVRVTPCSSSHYQSWVALRLVNAMKSSEAYNVRDVEGCQEAVGTKPDL